MPGIGLVDELKADAGADDFIGDPLGHFVVGLAIEGSAGRRFAYAAPLFEKEAHARSLALLADAFDPCPVHWPGAGATFATDNHPTDAVKVQPPQVLQERFDGKEANTGPSVSENFDARNT